MCGFCTFPPLAAPAERGWFGLALAWKRAEVSVVWLGGGLRGGGEAGLPLAGG